MALADRFRLSVAADGGAHEQLPGEYTGASATVTGLLASTRYTFKVFAGNRAGFEALGRESNNVTTTSVGQPAAGVTGLRVGGVTTSSVLVTWDAPPARENVTHFRVTVAGEGVSDPPPPPSY